VSFQVGPGVSVRLAYRVFDADGEAIDDASELLFVFGYGALLPAIEEQLDGAREGERLSFNLPPERAFGRRNPKAVIEVDREDFPEDVAAGDRFEADADDGRPVLLQVLDVTPEAVVLDGNHPLAGQRLRFDIEVLELRPASAEELAEAERRLGIGEPHPADSATSPLIPLGRLLRGPSQR
jgi:FKBP-type peptidyl-prolyl cis-trans isomerase SlyD